MPVPRLLLTIVSIGAILVVCSCSVKEPGGSPDDAYMAQFDPDEYAWQLFFYLNRPAIAGVAGEADPQRHFGEICGVKDPRRHFGEVCPDTAFVWETWALASSDQSEVFTSAGDPPPHDWQHLVRQSVSRRLKLTPNLESQMITASLKNEWRRQFQNDRKSRHRRWRNQQAFETWLRKLFPPEVENNEQEVRINEAAFEGILDKKLFSANGLEAQRDFSKGDVSYIQMDRHSKEVKAEWLPLPDEDSKNRYVWRLGPDGKPYGLVAMHITTKDLPMWFWATFVHKDCEKAIGACKARSFKAYENKPVDSTTGLGAKHGSDGVRYETRGTVWENYILHGTQTNFVRPDGTPTELANPVIEAGQAKSRSSCITCHSYATVGPSEDGDHVKYLDINNLAGAPCARWFQEGIKGPCRPVDTSSPADYI